MCGVFLAWSAPHERRAVQAMKWTDAQYAAHLKRQGHAPPAVSPKRGRTPKQYALIHKSRVTRPVLINILGVALQERFPGVFTPIPSLGIHWGNEALKVGVQAGGWPYAGHERDGWRVLPCLPRVIIDNRHTLMQNVENLLKEMSCDGIC